VPFLLALVSGNSPYPSPCMPGSYARRCDADSWRPSSRPGGIQDRPLRPESEPHASPSGGPGSHCGSHARHSLVPREPALRFFPEAPLRQRQRQLPLSFRDIIEQKPRWSLLNSAESASDIISQEASLPLHKKLLVGASPSASQNAGACPRRGRGRTQRTCRRQNVWQLRTPLLYDTVHCSTVLFWRQNSTVSAVHDNTVQHCTVQYFHRNTTCAMPNCGYWR